MVQVSGLSISLLCIQQLIQQFDETPGNLPTVKLAWQHHFIENLFTLYLQMNSLKRR